MGTAARELQGDEFLCANLEYLASLNPPAISPVLPRLQGGMGPLPDDFQLPLTSSGTTTAAAASIILQVNAVEDVSLPLAQRLRAMAPSGTTLAVGGPEATGSTDDEAQLMSVDEMLRSMESDEPPSQRRGRRQRLLRLTLTDGFTRIVAVEDCRRGCRALRGGVAWGAKLRITAPLKILHGVLILTSELTEMLGGWVVDMQVFWEKYAVARLEEMSGKPRRRVQEKVEEDTVVSSSSVPAGGGNVFWGAQNTGEQQQQQRQEVPFVVPQHSTNVAPLLPPQQQQSSTPQIQPLSAWQSHHPATAPFTTIAVIKEVTSELTIRELPTQFPNESKRFSLLVQLSSPPPNACTHAAETTEAELTVDLGHKWLRHALQMDPDAFRALFHSRQPDGIASLGALVENVGNQLENFGVGVFVLQQRPDDGVIEVVEMKQFTST